MTQPLSPKEQREYSKLLQEELEKPENRYIGNEIALRLRKTIIAERKKNAEPPFPAQEKILMMPGIIPIIPERHISPLSNWLAKTSVFAPRKAGTRHDTGLNWKKLSSPKGVEIFYNGPELDMADHTLYLILVKMAEGRGGDEVIRVNRSKILKLCGYGSIGASSYKWLSEAMDRLKQANIKIKVDNSVLVDSEKQMVEKYNQVDVINGFKKRRIHLTLSIIGNVATDPDSGDYFYTMPHESLTLFAGQLYGYNDLVKRKKIKRGKRPELSAWLQSYICSDSSGEHHPILLATLKAACESGARISDFRTRLQQALENLAQNDIIQSWALYKNEKKEYLVKWKR